jgi:para-nitrobenzyl esterase
MRKNVLPCPRLIALVFCGAAILQGATPVSGDPITIDAGKVAGTVLDSGIHAYLGIPFGAPPVGDLRWHEPVPAKPWTGVYDASATKPACAQAGAGNQAGGANQSSEDCLYLNVWVPPAAKAGAKLPVMVFIYGGGFTGGSASTPNYSSAELARRGGVVTVNLAYRVGIFGYFAHPELSKESGHNASGDWGSLDQIAGLKWIQRNIAAFGGDPANVTVMGQSAGGESIYQLQASPLARGLFARLSPWSGADLAPGGQVPHTLAEGEAAGVKVQQLLRAKSVADMRALPFQQVLAAVVQGQGQAPAGGGGNQTRPIVDGYFLPDFPDKIFKAGKHIDVPLYTSSTQQDLGSALQFYDDVKTLADLQKIAAAVFGDAAGEFLKLFPASSDEEARKVALIVSGDTGFGVSNRDWACDAALHGKQPVYLAQWAHVPPPNKSGPGNNRFGDGPSHGSDIPYWLGTYVNNNNKVWSDWDRELSAKMQDSLIAFARTSNPSTGALKIPRYDPNDEQRIVFGDTVYIDKLNTAQIEFLRAHVARRGGTAVAR